MIRDYGYKFYMENSTIGDIVDSGSFPVSGTNAYALTPVYTAGLGLKFGKGKTMASSFYFEADNPINFIEKATADFGPHSISSMWGRIETPQFSFPSRRLQRRAAFLRRGHGFCPYRNRRGGILGKDRRRRFRTGAERHRSPGRSPVLAELRFFSTKRRPFGRRFSFTQQIGHFALFFLTDSSPCLDFNGGAGLYYMMPAS